MKSDTRSEHDSMGSVAVPRAALYGAQTQRAVQNFTISPERLPITFINAILIIKQAAALVNRDLGLLSAEKAAAIIFSVETLLDKQINDHFPVSVFQTGSGTSTNMNVNEVICGRAREKGIELSANDDVNLGQSSNDVIPSALHLAAARQMRSSVIPALTELTVIIRDQAQKHKNVIKTGRTHLMDALPIRLQNELEGWASQVDDNITRLNSSLLRLLRLPLGGTAVGSGVNCHPLFAEKTLALISKTCGLNLQKMDSAYKGLSCIDTVLETSGHLKTTAVTLMKIANDLRWMNSGPSSGLGEIILPALQPGSSIMPDKINPVIPEAVCMAAARVIGNDTTITIAAQSGNFQLNTMLPLAAADLLQSTELISGAARSLGSKAIRDVQVRVERMEAPLKSNPILVTSLAPYIGYLEAARIAKMARQEQRSVYEVALDETEIEQELLERLLDPGHLADGGNNSENKE